MMYNTGYRSLTRRAPLFVAIGIIAMSLTVAAEPLRPALPEDLNYPAPNPQATQSVNPARAQQPSPAPSANAANSENEARRAEVIRRWLKALDPAQSASEAGSEGVNPAAEAALADAAVYGGGSDYWLHYISLPVEMPARGRERELQRLLEQPVPDTLRAVILRDLSSDLSFQSRRTQFIRRYGFYANWFNRITHTTSRVLQGNVQAVGQLFVDAAFALGGDEDVSPAERRLAELMRRLDTEGRITEEDRKKLEKLERRIAREQAEADIRRARFALEQADPDSALFYARSALSRRPDLKRAEKVRDEATAEIAARNRRAVASLQVGYPDRNPPVDLNSPDLLRSVLLYPVAAADSPPTQSLAAAGAPRTDEQVLLKAIELAAAEPADDVPLMREWAAMLHEAPHEASAEVRWLRELLADPNFNPDLRRARAQVSRRGRMMQFVFAGPETNRERAYTFSSRMATAFDALGQVGIFYGFEVIYRAGMLAFSPPPPTEEMLTATAEFVQETPPGEERRDAVRWLADQYEHAGRFQQARTMLASENMMGGRRERELNEKEARRLLATAEAMPAEEPLRQAMLERAGEIGAGGVAERARRELENPSADPDRAIVEVKWETFAAWHQSRLPEWFPAKTEWFDGQTANGEIGDEVFRIEGEPGRGEAVLIAFAIVRGERWDLVQEWVPLAGLPEEAASWLNHHLEQQERVREGIDRFGRPKIPVGVSGGAGLSGVDFYPRLRPIESDAFRIERYAEE